MSDTAAGRLYNTIKGSMTYIPPTSPATVTEIINMSMDLFEDGVREYSGEDTDYTHILAITEADLNSDRRRPDFKTFLRFLKFLGIVPLHPEEFKRSLLTSATAPSKPKAAVTTPSKLKTDPSTIMSPFSPGVGGSAGKGNGAGANAASIFDDD
jgi:hypothetical protein